ncbi:MAG: dicarboxylate/amino acid:cation symporter [Bacteroidales bacterium]
MKKIGLHWQILAALILGVLYGIFFKENYEWVSWMGDIFLRALKMVVVPLILFSIIYGVASIGSGDNLGRIGLKTMAFYIGTTILAILTGLLLMNLFSPGVGAQLTIDQSTAGKFNQSTSIRDILINIVPDNIFQAFANSNTLQVILFAILFGVFIGKIREESKKSMLAFFEAGSEVMMRITMFVIAFAPLGIFGIVSKQVAQQSDLVELLSRLGAYFGVVLLGLFIQSGISLPFILSLFRVNPIRHYKAISQVLITAFSTSSSNATLPLTMSTVEQNCGVSRKICSFTLPLGATINMNGTALYEIAAALFIAQVYAIHLTLGQQCIMVLTALLAAVGAAGIPMAGLVTMTIVLSSAGLPLEGVALVLPIDRPLDMFRTLVNVLGDTCGAVVVAKTEGEEVKV